MPGSLKTVARELAKYRLDLVRVQVVRWDKGGRERVSVMLMFSLIDDTFKLLLEKQVCLSFSLSSTAASL